MSENNSSSKSEYDFKTPAIALLVLIAIGYGAQYWYDNVRTPSSYDTCLMGFNYTDRSIADFSVNGYHGHNMEGRSGDWPYSGGGGGACGVPISGNIATVRWEFEMDSVADYENHVKPETHEVKLPMPKAQSNKSRYFQVRIFPDNNVELKLVDTFEDRNAEETKLLKKLYEQRDNDLKQKELAIKAEEAEKARKFDEENEAAYQRYKAEREKQHQAEHKEQK